MYVIAQRQTGMSGACRGPACGYRRRRRGMGAVSCPGDPSCPGYVDPYLNAAMQGGGTCNCVNGVCTDAANFGNSCGALTTAQSAAQAQQASSLIAAQDTSTLTGWLNVNSGLVTFGAAIVGLVLVMGGRR